MWLDLSLRFSWMLFTDAGEEKVSSKKRRIVKAVAVAYIVFLFIATVCVLAIEINMYFVSPSKGVVDQQDLTTYEPEEGTQHRPDQLNKGHSPPANGRQEK
jgi:hypothetical protein